MEERVNEDRDRRKLYNTTSEHFSKHSADKSSSIDSINNNFISGFFEKFNNFHSVAAKAESDESSLPSPKAMLETIMPCENISKTLEEGITTLYSPELVNKEYNEFRSNNFRISDALKTIIKTEMSEKKVSCELNYDKSSFPMNLKSSSRCQQDCAMKSKSHMDKIDHQDDDYDHCESPKAKRMFLESHEINSKLNKHKSGDNGQKFVVQPSSPCQSSHSSRSSISSPLNVHQQKQIMADHCLNGSMEDISLSGLHAQKAQLRENVLNLNQRAGSLGLVGNHSNLLTSGLPQMSMGLAQSPQMPQLVLANGHLSQGIQGAQVLIPTAQGITSQTILTIPVSQQLPTNLTIDHLIQALSTLSQKQQAAENNVNSNHVLSNVPTLSPNPILLNSHLLATGAQQLLTIQPQLLALQQNHQKMQQQQQQQQQQQDCNSFLRKMHQNHLENFDSHSRKDQINMQMKMRSREMNKRLCRMGGRPMNGNNDMNFYEHFESHSPIYSPSNLPSNGENQINSSKSSSSHKDAVCISPSSPSQLHHSSKLQSPSLSNKTSQSQSVMAELLTENSNCQESQSKVERNSPTQDNSLKINKNSIDEKQCEANSERISTASPDNRPASVAMSPSHHYSNDSNSGDANHDQSNNQATNEDIDLDEINEFAQAFKLQRLSLGLTQTQVGQALSVSEGPAYSQSAICSALAARMYAAVQLSSQQQQQQQQQQMFEKLDITPKSAQKIKPVLEQWMKEAKGRFKMGESPLSDFMGVESSKKRKRRTSFTPHALEILNSSFERNTHPSGTDITSLAQALGYEREVIRIWFCNKRQALKNTVRMMSKGMSN